MAKRLTVIVEEDFETGDVESSVGDFTVITPGGYSVSIEECPGCFSQGNSPEEALRNIADAYELWSEAQL